MSYLHTLVLVPLILSGCATTNVQLPRESYLFVAKTVEFQVCESSQCTVNLSATTGSGFVIRSDDSGSWGITAGHLCSWAPSNSGSDKSRSSISVHLFGGGQHEAVVAVLEPLVDICVLHIPGVKLPTVRIASRPPKLGDKVHNLASPLGVFEPTLVPQFSGYYSGEAKVPASSVIGKKTVPFSAYTLPARPGSSGSPIFNTSGEVIGMVSIALVHFENFALSPPHSVLEILFEAVGDLKSGP